MEEKLRQLLENPVPCDKEVALESALILMLARLEKYPIIQYGAAALGYYDLCWLRSKGLEPICFVDIDEARDGEDFFGVEVVHPSRLNAFTGGRKALGVVSCGGWRQPREQALISSILHGAGCVYVLSRNYNDFYYDFWSLYYTRNRRALLSLFNMLEDGLSREILLEFVRCVMESDSYRGPERPTAQKYFDESVFRWRPDEQIVDCGGNVLDTAWHLLERGLPFETFYSFEPGIGEHAWSRVMKDKFPAEFGERIALYGEMLGAPGQGGGVTLDEALAGRPVTLLKMDIEGAELDALRGAEGIIRGQKPVLAVTAYHKKEDLVLIPAYIKGLAPEYRLYLRKYWAHWHSVNSNCEMVLYAVPTGR